MGKIKIEEVDASKQSSDHTYVPPQNDSPFTASNNPDQKPEGFDSWPAGMKKMHAEYGYKRSSYDPPLSVK